MEGQRDMGILIKELNPMFNLTVFPSLSSTVKIVSTSHGERWAGLSAQQLVTVLYTDPNKLIWMISVMSWVNTHKVTWQKKKKTPTFF